MFSPLWFLSLVSLLMMDIGTGAIQQKEVEEPRRCYLCVASNTTSCDQPSSRTTVECLGPCATVAVAPNFTSSLQCADAASSKAREPCSLNNSRPPSLTCLCRSHLCNAPIPPQLTNDLLNFNSTNQTADLEAFFKIYANFTAEVYKTETTEMPLNVTTSTTTVSVKVEHSENNEVPRAEPLKQEATAPSDDDEDESEGSGVYEEQRSHRQPAAAPAAPSSFLPADENKSPKLFTHLFLTSPFLFYFIL